MGVPQVYLDTSVIGGCCDDEFAKWSLSLMRDIRLGLLVPVISSLTERELKDAPPDVQAHYDNPHQYIEAAIIEDNHRLLGTQSITKWFTRK